MDCSLVPELEFEEWANSFWPKARAERWPLSGSIELTFRCNLNCVHCYCNLPAGDTEARSGELASGEIRSIVDQIVAEGCLWLCFTGGEPLLRPDFQDIYLHAKKSGMLITLFTNGTLVDERIADFLAEWPPRRVEVTLYGMTEETYEAVTRVRGAFARCWRGIELLLERELPLVLKTTVTTLNAHEVPEIREYAKERRIRYRYDPLLIPRLDGSKEPTWYRIPPEQVVELDRLDEARVAVLRELGVKYQGSSFGNELFSCGAGKNGFNIDPYGNLGLCMSNRYHTYSLRKGSFEEAWHQYVPSVRALTVGAQAGDDECRSCARISLCGQCPAWSYLEHGDFYSRVEYLCEIAHLREKVLLGGMELQGTSIVST
jgi:radical SAM protein with 4Fe4S-binding SPASM domain